MLYRNKAGELRIAGEMTTETLREILTSITDCVNAKDVDLSTLYINTDNISPIYSPFIKTTQLLLFALNDTKDNIVNIQQWENNDVLNALFNDSRILKTSIDKCGVSYIELMKRMDKYCNSNQSQIPVEEMLIIKQNIDKIFQANTINSNLSEQEKIARIEKYEKLSKNWVKDCNEKAKSSVDRTF